jgi:hypothetical protein
LGLSTLGGDKMSLVEKNQYGYWDRSDERLGGCCLLLSVLNVLRNIGRMNDETAEQIAGRFERIQQSVGGGYYITKLGIPKGIELMTCGDYLGVLVDFSARNQMRLFSLAENPRYAADRWNELDITCPSIGIVNQGHHAVAIVGHSKKCGDCEIVDNGIPNFIPEGRIEFIYRIIDGRTRSYIGAWSER